MYAVGESFLVKVGKYLTTRMHSCSSSCIICDAPLGYEGVKPAVCPKPLCMHRCVLCAVRVRCLFWLTCVFAAHQFRGLRSGLLAHVGAAAQP